LNEEDGEEVLFVSVHGYGGRDLRGVGAFYPGSGRTRVPSEVGKKEKEEEKGEETKKEEVVEEVEEGREEGGEEGGEGPLILDVGMGLVDPSESVPGTSRVEWRKAMREKVLPKLAAFKPDMVFISAGFDAHRKVRREGGRDGGREGTSRMEWREAMRETVLPKLAAFKPDMVFISAGIDAHGFIKITPPRPPPPCLPHLVLATNTLPPSLPPSVPPGLH